MELLTTILILILQLSLVVVGIAVWQHVKMRKLAKIIRQYRDKPPAPVQTDSHQELGKSLDKAIESVHSVQKQAADNPQLQHAYVCIGRTLEQNRDLFTKKIDGSAYLDHFQHILQDAGKLPPVKPMDARPDQSGMIKVLNERIAILNSRIQSLEKFKEGFFDLKKKVSGYQQLNENLVEHIEILSPTNTRPEELQQLLNQVSQEKNLLEEQLEKIETELNEITRKIEDVVTGSQKRLPHETRKAENRQNLDQTRGKVDNGLQQVQTIVNSQAGKIQTLLATIEKLNLEVEEVNHLKEQIENLVLTNKEMTDAIFILQSENEYLQEQIQQLLEDDVHANYLHNDAIQELTEKLSAQEQAYFMLEKKYADMEKEYLAMYEEMQEAKNKSR